VYTAKARGARVWAGVRSSQKGAAAALGVEGIVGLDELHDGEREAMFDAIADTVGGPPTQNLLGAIRRGGVVATVVGEPSGARERGLEVRKVWARPNPDLLSVLLRAVADGTLVIPIAKRFPLSQIREAHQTAQKGGGGKVIVQM
jgi:NADPH:quinone reductase-like Zn-dependent oxidoreductase